MEHNASELFYILLFILYSTNLESRTATPEKVACDGRRVLCAVCVALRCVCVVVAVVVVALPLCCVVLL